MRGLAAATVIVLASAGCTERSADQPRPDTTPPSTTRDAATTAEATKPTSSVTAIITEATPAESAEPTTVVRTSAPTTAGTATTTPASPGAVLALDVLSLVRVENEQQAGYDSGAYGHPADADGNGCSTREEVLIEEGAEIRVGIGEGRCEIVSGLWMSVYDGVEWTDPNALEVDHVVALKEAHDSGAWAWDDQRRTAFANDLSDRRTLRAVTAAVNKAKGDADPSNWLPPRDDARCQYLADWVSIKVRWGLSMDQSEHGRIRNLLTDSCPGQLIESWSAVPAPPPTPTVPPPPVTTTPALQPVAPLPPPAGDDCDPSYPTICVPPPPPDLDCGDIIDRRFQVLPPDPHRFDGEDDDGVGCESG